MQRLSQRAKPFDQVLMLFPRPAVLGEWHEKDCRDGLDMKIDFSKDEFRALMDMVEMAEWVLHSHVADEQEETKEYTAVSQKILSCAKDMGFEHYIEYSQELDGYYATAAYEEESPHMQYIDDFEEYVFWDSLTHKLAVRDLVEQVGSEAYEKMKIQDRISMLSDLENWYGEEFDENGLKHIRVVNRSNGSKSTDH